MQLHRCNRATGCHHPHSIPQLSKKCRILVVDTECKQRSQLKSLTVQILWNKLPVHNGPGCRWKAYNRFPNLCDPVGSSGILTQSNGAATKKHCKRWSQTHRGSPSTGEKRYNFENTLRKRNEREWNQYLGGGCCRNLYSSSKDLQRSIRGPAGQQPTALAHFLRTVGGHQEGIRQCPGVHNAGLGTPAGQNWQILILQRVQYVQKQRCDQPPCAQTPHND